MCAPLSPPYFVDENDCEDVVVLVPAEDWIISEEDVLVASK